MSLMVTRGAMAIVAMAVGVAAQPAPSAGPRGQATVVPASEFQAVVATLGTQRNIDKVVRTVDTRGPAGMVSIAAVAYKAGPQDWNGTANEHGMISEVFYITKGSATFVFGGDLENAVGFDPKSEAVRTVFGPGRGARCRAIDGSPPGRVIASCCRRTRRTTSSRSPKTSRCWWCASTRRGCSRSGSAPRTAVRDRSRRRSR